MKSSGNQSIKEDGYWESWLFLIYAVYIGDRVYVRI
jgi:hypothetical protein